MVRVYFTDGHWAEVSMAQSIVADLTNEWPALPKSSSGYTTLICKDAGGQEVARFRTDQVRGYIVSADD